MFHRVYLFFICIGIACTSLSSEASALVLRTFTPASSITLTGMTDDVRFDLAGILFGTDIAPAYLDTKTSILSGAFYIKNIGWTLLSTGSYQVYLTCPVVLSDITTATSPCQLSGFAWSENAGDIDFANIRYNPSNSSLSGDIHSFAGDFSLAGIRLPLIPLDTFEILDTSIHTHHESGITVKNHENYGDGAWSGILIPSKNPTFVQRLAGSYGIYSLDLSLADTYTLILQDPQGSQTKWTGIQVIPGNLSQDLFTTDSTFIEDFCKATPNEARCIDRSATIVQKVGNNVIADGQSYYEFGLRPRDRYGNPIDTGEIIVTYTGTVSAVQIPSGMMSSAYILTGWHDALIFGGEVFTTSYDGSWENILPIRLVGQDIRYTIASVAPTDNADNIVMLNTITYIATDGTKSILRDPTRIHFGSPYLLHISPPHTVLVGSHIPFMGGFSGFTTLDLHPSIEILIHIGGGILAEFQDITATIPFEEKSTNPDWYTDSVSPSTLTITGIQPETVFAFTGIYTPRTAYPELENIVYQSFVHLLSRDNSGNPIQVLYPSTPPSSTATAEHRPSRVKILGQNNARSEYGNIVINTKKRTEIFNLIRKNVALMSRNRTQYMNTPYNIIDTMDVRVDAEVLNQKDTVIVIGHDIIVTADIPKNPDKPVALIALADRQGRGGNIKIEPHVTDIYAGLFAEHSVFSTGSNQLYIYGSLISANTLGETVAGICPYYVVGTCDAVKYDLEELRAYTGITSGSPSSGASEYPGTSLIIEYDIRLQLDPPPGLSY